MKRLSCLALTLALAGVVDVHAEACHRRVQNAFLSATSGKPVTADDLRGCWGSLRWTTDGHRASENIPMLAAGAGILSGLQPARDLLPLLRGQDPWPPGEICSPIYGSWLTMVLLAVLNEGDLPPAVEKATRRYLRAQWTLFVLSAASSPPRSIEILSPGEPPIVRAVQRGGYQGGWLHCPGMHAMDIGSDGYWIDRTDLHPLLSAALGLEWRPRREIKAAAGPGEPQWVLSAVVRIAESHQAPATFWGLKEQERAALRGFLEEPSVDRARRIVRWLAPLRPPAGVVRTLVFFEGGALLHAQNVETNRVKRTQQGFVAAGRQGRPGHRRPRGGPARPGKGRAGAGVVRQHLYRPASRSLRAGERPHRGDLPALAGPRDSTSTERTMTCKPLVARLSSPFSC